MRQRFRDLGGSISRIDAAQVEAANDAIAEMGVAMGGLGRTLTIELAPYITAVATTLADIQSKSGGWGEALAGAFRRAGKAAAWLADRALEVKLLGEAAFTGVAIAAVNADIAIAKVKEDEDAL